VSLEGKNFVSRRGANWHDTMRNPGCKYFSNVPSRGDLSTAWLVKAFPKRGWVGDMSGNEEILRGVASVTASLSSLAASISVSLLLVPIFPTHTDPPAP